ncbi:MAG TPA: sphingomyelin phosphodiesterase [Sphingomonas sp.]|nr:sphingomyelin phosphodiesterase [Sphingomonas sp.]
MVTKRYLAAGVAALVLVGAPATAKAGGGAGGRDLSLMTYNVHGLPWPITDDRSADLAAIGARLKAMRSTGKQPAIVVLQEAFVADAKAIGRTAGYRYAAFGPAEQASAPVPHADDGFVDDGSRLVGERLGKHVDSGLAIFSDYPILAVRRMAYPVCAGYDCLANKGAVAALIAVPGIATPIVVVDTHLNSNGASGAASPRAIYAYRRQLDLLAKFIGSLGAGNRPILVAGDFNVGRDLARRTQFDLRMLGGEASLQTAVATCRIAPTCTVADPSGMAISIGRGKDWMMYRASPTVSIRPIALAAPFGRAANGSMLSDHVGVSVRYRIDTLKPLALPNTTTLASR